MLKLGYMIPEFPGQTHIFFWREIVQLQSMDCEVRLVSTRPPPLTIRSHAWSDEAKAKTKYLLEARNLSAAIPLLLAVLSFSPLAWLRVFKFIMREPGKIGLLACAIFGARLAVIAREENWDHLHVHSAAKSAMIACFAKILSGLPYSLSLHGPVSDYGPHQKLKWSQAAFGIVITEKLKKELADELGPSSMPAAIGLAPMGVNIGTFVRPDQYKAWRQDGSARIFSTGRLNPCKGHAELIQAVAALRDAGIPVRLEIAGEDEQGGVGYRKELQTIIDHLKLGDAAQLLGAVSESRVREGLMKAHIFALASVHEPLGVAIMEAMALEMPVVVTGAGGVKELVTHGLDGYLVDDNKVSTLAYGIDRVLHDPDMAERLAQRSRQTIMERFQDDRSAAMLLRLIREKKLKASNDKG